MNRSIFIIRHGEKPPEGENGVDAHGNDLSPHSLSPTGWQRANALVTFFAGPGAVLARPKRLIAPDYGEKRNPVERTHQTIAQLGIESWLEKEQGADLGRQVAAASEDVTLICWEHHAIPDIANELPTPPGTRIPQSWPGHRFDVVWVFKAGHDGTYAFCQVPQLLLPGDEDSIIDP